MNAFEQSIIFQLLQISDNFKIVNIFFESVATSTPSLSQLHTSKQSSQNDSSQEGQVDEEHVRVKIVFYNSSQKDENTNSFIEAVKKALGCVKEDQKKWK